MILWYFIVNCGLVKTPLKLGKNKRLQPKIYWNVITDPCSKSYTGSAIPCKWKGRGKLAVLVSRYFDEDFT